MEETSLITRCPACATAFRARESQLSARDGQVRCGRCATVFNAPAHALPMERGTNKSSAEAVSPPEESTDSLHAQAGGDAAAQTALEQEPTASSPEPLVLTPAPSEALPHEIEVAPPPPLHSDVADPNLEFDFGRPRRSPAIVRRLLSLSALGLLILVLVAQVAHHFRGDIALLFPQTKSALEAACAFAGCDLPLPRRADMMSIESSDLQADTLNPGVMVLSATLRNRAPFAQTPPALELTLTDAQDQPLARRVLTVADYLPRTNAGTSAAPSGGFEKAFPPGTEFPVKIYFDASAVQPTGYRLYLFYP